MADSTIEPNGTSDTYKPKDADNKSKSLSISERILLSWVWATGLGLFAAAFVWCCTLNVSITLITLCVVAVLGVITAALGRTKYSAFAALLLLVCFCFLISAPFLSAYIFFVCVAGFFICSICLSLLGWRRKHWAFPLVICSMAIGYSYGAGYAIHQQLMINEMRARFPLENLKTRLAYQEVSASRIDPQPYENKEKSDSTLEGSDWDQIDAKWGNRRRSADRTQNLRSIHDEATRRFVMMPNFGVGRMGPPSIEPMDQVTLRDISFGSLAGFWPDGIESSPESNEDHWFNNLNTARNTWQYFVFSTEHDRLEFLYHLAASQDFLDPKFFGYTNQDGLTAGFVEHGFHFAPPGIRTENDSWKLVQLQLVSLDRFDLPRAYVLDNLPRMDKLTGEDVPTRELDSFELDALEKLRGGEEIVVQSDQESLQMVGALRSRQSCMQCHSGNKHDLLGAFSYRFKPVE
jgi:hypothetical protein